MSITLKHSYYSSSAISTVPISFSELLIISLLLHDTKQTNMLPGVGCTKRLYWTILQWQDEPTRSFNIVEIIIHHLDPTAVALF